MTDQEAAGRDDLEPAGAVDASTNAVAPVVNAGATDMQLQTKPRWETPAFVILLLTTGGLYLWNLAASGYANAFYSAAAQAGGESWWAFLWGASDMGASITVDKPPASIWVMALSVRLFGLSSWSILVPQALLGVASVAVLYRIVRRHFSAAAALLSGVTFAVTPVAALMFRFNNPDALLVFLLIAAVWAAMRAIDGPRTTRWMLLAGAIVGLAFLTKQLQAFLILPALAVAFLWAAPGSWWARIRDGLLAVVAMVVTAGWWVALVELWPAADRPYIGGSQNNSFLELTFGYNGLGRITGEETGSVGGSNQIGAMWGQTGLTRLFTGEIGGQITWLLPAAAVFAIVLLWRSRSSARTDGPRAQIVVWSLWLLVTVVTFSFMAGIFHAYYTVALVPAVAALVGIGAVGLWRLRAERWARSTLAAVTVVTTVWAVVLLGRSADFLVWLTPVVVIAGIVGATLLAIGTKAGPRLGLVGAGGALIAGLAGPVAYTINTVGTAHTGSLVTAGPTVNAGLGSMGPAFGQQGDAPSGDGTQPNGPQGMPGELPGLPPGAHGGNSNHPGAGFNPPNGNSEMGGFSAGGPGGLLESATVGAELAELLSVDGSEYRWVAAVVGAQNAASYQLETGFSVMPIGGFNGSDPSPTLEQFQSWVDQGQVHYYIGSGLGRNEGQEGAVDQIGTWVAENFTATTVAGVTVFDLTTPTP